MWIHILFFLLTLLQGLEQITARIWCDVTQPCVSQPYVQCRVGQGKIPIALALSCNSRPGSPLHFHSNKTIKKHGNKTEYVMTFQWQGPNDDSKSSILGYTIDIGDPDVMTLFKSYYIDLSGNEQVFTNKSLFGEVLALKHFLHCKYDGQSKHLDVVVTSLPVSCSPELNRNDLTTKVYLKNNEKSRNTTIKPDWNEDRKDQVDLSVISISAIMCLLGVSIFVSFFLFYRRKDIRKCRRNMESKQKKEKRKGHNTLGLKESNQNFANNGRVYQLADITEEEDVGSSKDSASFDRSVVRSSENNNTDIYADNLKSQNLRVSSKRLTEHNDKDQTYISRSFSANVCSTCRVKSLPLNHPHSCPSSMTSEGISPNHQCHLLHTPFCADENVRYHILHPDVLQFSDCSDEDTEFVHPIDITAGSIDSMELMREFGKINFGV